MPTPFPSIRAAILCALACASACAGFKPDKLSAIDTAITGAITANRIPGGVLWVERAGESYSRAYGQRAVVPAPESLTTDTIYDAASLTKVIATTTAIMQLVERGRLELDAPVARTLPAFAAEGFVSQKGQWIVNKAETKVPADAFIPPEAPMVVSDDDGGDRPPASHPPLRPTCRHRAESTVVRLRHRHRARLRRETCRRARRHVPLQRHQLHHPR